MKLGDKANATGICDGELFKGPGPVICDGELFKGPGPAAGCPAAEEEQEQECIHIEQQETNKNIFIWNSKQEQEYTHMEQQERNNNIFTWSSKRRTRTRARMHSHGTAKQQEQE